VECSSAILFFSNVGNVRRSSRGPLVAAGSSRLCGVLAPLEPARSDGPSICLPQAKFTSYLAPCLFCSHAKIAVKRRPASSQDWFL